MEGLQIIMRSKQQKQIENDGQFQQIQDQIQTLNAPNFIATIKNKNIRKQKPSEKAKLGLLQPSNFSSIIFANSTSKTKRQSFGKILKIGSVTFRSNYECGHIGNVQQIGINTYKIGLDCQSNSTRGNTWFNFTTEGIKGQAKFIIEGFTKSSSLYNNGMKICYKDSKEPKWRRGGLNIAYVSSSQEVKNYQIQFTHFFKNNQQSSVQFAYAFPYGLTKLQHLISQIQTKVNIQILGRTYQNRQIPLLNIGNPNSKELIILSARVHPGETCSSFIMEGLLKELLSENDHAKFLRQTFYFKVVPMINLDGVALGNYRFSATGMDLNRKWKQPTQLHHSQILSLKQMIIRQSKLRKVRMYIDMHGHSRKKNVFFYGCSRSNDQIQQYANAKAFPFLMSKIHNAFNYFDCTFNVQRQKEGTARISMWKQLKINQIYTLQASMCGSQTGGNYTQSDYEKIGKKLCEGISIYFSPQSDNPSIKKLIKFKEGVVTSLLSDPLLLKMGEVEDSGSDSQPQKGELPPKPAQQCKQVTKRLKINSYNSNVRRFQKNSSLKHKCETTIPEQKDFVRQKQFFQYLFQLPSQQSAHDKKYHPPSMFTNKRVNSLSGNNYYRTNIKSITYNQQEIYIGEDKSGGGKNKANLLVGWEGAQYRRVRKMAQLNWKRQSSLGNFEVKGLKSNKIQIENVRTLIPKLSTNVQQSKHRRTSAEMFFKKPLKDEKLFYERDQVDVLCRGRQIAL